MGKNYVSWGEGIAFDTVNGVHFAAIENVQFNFGMELLEIEDADAMNNQFVPIKAPVDGRLSFGKLSSGLWAILTGGSATAGGFLRVRDEATVLSSGSFSLNATPYTYSEVIHKVGGPLFTRVSASPATAEYSISGSHVVIDGTVNGETSTYVVDYLKETASDQVIVSVEDSDIPVNFGIVATYRAVDKEAAAESLGDMVIVCPKIRRSGAITFGSGARAQNKIEFDFVVETSAGNPIYKLAFPSS